MTDEQAWARADQLRTPSRAAWRRACRKARRLFPLDAPVRIVRRVLAGNTTGLWWGDATGHRITVNARLQLGPAVDALLHEYAHAWLAEHGGDDADHGDRFWLVFGKFYRAWMHEVRRARHRGPVDVLAKGEV